MKHVSSRLLFDYWNDRRGDELAPERGDIEPGPIRGGLERHLHSLLQPLTGHTFRLAGTRVCALVGHELKGHAFIDLWDKPKRRPLLDLTDHRGGRVRWPRLRRARVDRRRLFGRTGVAAAAAALRGRSRVRMIGVLAPLTSPYWLGASPIVTIALGAHRFVGSRADSLPPPTLAIPDEVMARVRHGWSCTMADKPEL